MNKALRIELWKMLHEPMFYLAVAIGLAIAGINVAETVRTTRPLIEMNLEMLEKTGGQFGGFDGVSLFYKWIGVDLQGQWSQYFYLVWPILAALPFGWSYSTERKNGVYNQIVCRMGARHYFGAKYITVFVGGGLAVAVPVLLNLLVEAMFLPAITPNVLLMQTVICDGYFLSKLYFTHPWVHGLLWCLLDFLWGGAAACLCFIVGSRLRLKVMVILSPFVLIMLLDAMYTVIQPMLKWQVELSPRMLAAAATMHQNPGWAVFTVMGVLLLASVILGYRQVVKHELG